MSSRQLLGERDPLRGFRQSCAARRRSQPGTASRSRQPLPAQTSNSFPARCLEGRRVRQARADTSLSWARRAPYDPRGAHSDYPYLGAIQRALPHAKLLVLKRSALDSCFAMYQTLFGEAYPFSYDFEDLRGSKAQ